MKIHLSILYIFLHIINENYKIKAVFELDVLMNENSLLNKDSTIVMIILMQIILFCVGGYER